MRRALRRFAAGKLIGIAALAAMLLIGTAPASAHVGSPDVFYEGNAGPYDLFVTVRVPQVIPGVAEIEIRSASDDVREIRTAVARLTGPGSKYVPVPDLAKRSAIDPRFFTSSLWLMEYGELQVKLTINGTRGTAEMGVPVTSFARGVLPMPRWLGAILLILATALGLGAIAIVGAAARESKLAPGASATPAYRRSGRIAMAVMTAITVAVFYLGFSWWDSDARSYAAMTEFFRAPKMTASLEGANRIAIRPTDETWLKYEKVEELVPDHGHLMHLFLLRSPGLDRMWHLHPQRTGSSFAVNLPAIDSGHYQVFADIVDKSGFPWTLVGTIDLPNVAGAALSGDDSQATAKPLSSGAENTIATLSDGTRVTWQRDTGPLRANQSTYLRFSVQDRNGNPANDLEPYMGMAAHAEIVSSDLSVFAHIHPSGSVSMASLMMAQADTPGAAAASMPATNMPAPAAEKVSPEISLPYGFPKPGLYRIFLQFKRAGKIETAVFDTEVK